MAARFKPLSLSDSTLFGLCLEGIVGRSDKKNLLDLADRCLEGGRVHLVIDLTQLKSMGGGAAAIMADFQRRLTESGGEAVFVGASETVRRFMEPKFEGLPLKFFETASLAEENFGAAGGPVETPDEVVAEEAPAEKKTTKKRAVKKAARKAAKKTAKKVAGKTAAKKGPTSKPAPKKADDEALCAMNEVLEEFNGPDEDTPTATGRRKEHKYTSLSEAVGALGSWTEYRDHTEYMATLRNLLFSHGLARDALLLVEREDFMEDPEQEWQLPMDCSLVRQLVKIGNPLTMLDIREDELGELETVMLEEIMPDIILPVKRGGKLAAVLMLNRGMDEEKEYTVAEHFALELLLRVLEEGGDRADQEDGEPAPKDIPHGVRPVAQPAGATSEWEPDTSHDDTIAEVLLKLALDLPDADDRPHFWRLFARHTWSVLPLKHLAFLAPDMSRPQVLAGENPRWEGLDLSGRRLQQFFRSMERPVAVANLPIFFKDVKRTLLGSGAEWLVSLTWEDEYLGMAIIGLESTLEAEEPADLIGELFAETSRLLYRFADTNDNADVNLQLVRILVAQREKRCLGSDKLTQAIVDHVNKLARVMGFPPDQERNLIYGCLLRDIGLIDKDDGLMKPPEQMDPTQWPVFRNHPADGAKLLENLNLPRTIIDVVHCHHERFNGDGFPRGLKGRKIPLAARVVTVVENYVAMVIGTDGQDPIKPETAARILNDNLGERYDPDIVSVFLKAIEAERGPSSAKPDKPKARAWQKELQKV